MGKILCDVLYLNAEISLKIFKPNLYSKEGILIIRKK